MTVLRGEVARRLMARTPRVREPDTVHVPSEQRPPASGTVLWTLAAGAREVDAAQGLPRRLRTELAALLEVCHGAEATKVSDRAALLTGRLLAGGAMGALRLSGTSSHLLVEILSGSAAVLPVRRNAPDLRTGHYRTLGETRTQYIHWARCRLPACFAGNQQGSHLIADDWA